MPTFSDEYERLLLLMAARMMNRRFGGVVGPWSEETENSDGTIDSFYDLNTTAHVVPTFLPIELLPGKPLPLPPPSANTADILFIDCLPLRRIEAAGLTRPVYLLINETGFGGPGPDTEFGPRLAPVISGVPGKPEYEPVLKVTPAVGVQYVLTPDADGRPLFDPVAGVLSFSGTPDFDVEADAVEITCWVWRGPTLADALNGLTGGDGNPLLSRCDLICPVADQNTGQVSAPFPLLIAAAPININVAQNGASIVFCNGKKMVYGVDYSLSADPSTDAGRLVLLNDAVQSGRYVVEAGDEIEIYVVRES